MKKFLFLIFILSICSCRTYKLSQQDLEWNPYVEGQKLVFKNVEGEEKVYYITKVHRSLSRTNVYAGTLSSKKEQLSVHWNNERNPDNPMENAILAISRATDKSQNSINFLIDFKDFKFSMGGHVIKAVENWKHASITIKGKKYSDVFIFPKDGKDRFNSPITKVYWSKQNGIVRMIYKQGGTYDLVPK